MRFYSDFTDKISEYASYLLLIVHNQLDIIIVYILSGKDIFLSYKCLFTKEMIKCVWKYFCSFCVCSKRKFAQRKGKKTEKK